MLIRRLVAHLKTQNWMTLSVELIVVVLGLFIGLQLDTWWEGRKELQLEKAYLYDLSEDFDTNQSYLLEASAGLERIIRSMIVLLEQSKLETPKMDADALNGHFALVQSLPSFFAVRRAYSNLTGSGDLRLIRDRELKNALADYYAQTEQILMVMQTHESELVQTFQPYIIKNLDYAAVAYERVDDFPAPPPIDEELILELVSTREFRNIAMQKWTIATDLYNLYRIQIAQNNLILEQLGALIE